MQLIQQGAVLEAFRRYARDFQTLQASAVVSHFHRPAIMISPRGVVALPDSEAVEGMYRGVMADLVKSSYARTDFRNLSEQHLSNELALVTGSGVWVDTAGKQLSSFGLSYTFRFSEGRWRIVVATIHDPSSDDAAIESLEQGFVAAFRAKNVDEIMSFCKPSNELFVFDLATPRQRVGREAFAQDWQLLFATMDGSPRVEMSDLAVTTNGSDLAFSHGIVHVSAKRIDGGAIDHRTRVTHVYQKSEGKWLILHEHVSVPIDMSTGKPDFLSKA
jgi:ketosteroid isomerase-like protein